MKLIRLETALKWEGKRVQGTVLLRVVGQAKSGDWVWTCRCKCGHVFRRNHHSLWARIQKGKDILCERCIRRRRTDGIRRRLTPERSFLKRMARSSPRHESLLDIAMFLDEFWESRIRAAMTDAGFAPVDVEWPEGWEAEYNPEPQPWYGGFSGEATEFLFEELSHRFR